MVIKSVTPISGDYAVLASCKSDFKRPCFDQQGDGHSFFWAVTTGLDGDYIDLIDVDIDGNKRVCERSLVVPKKPCPHCNHQMEPRYDNTHDPIFWQFCPSCGFIYDMRGHETDLDCPPGGAGGVKSLRLKRRTTGWGSPVKKRRYQKQKSEQSKGRR